MTELRNIAKERLAAGELALGTRFNGHGLGNGTSQDSLIAFSNVVNGTIGN